MTFLLLQAFLLMAASYFLGAFLGCWWRRAFYQEPQVETARASEAVAAGAAGAGGIAIPAAVTAGAGPVPAQPRIEYSSTPEGAGDATRFGRALSGTGTMAEPPPRPAKPAYVGVVTPPPAPAKPIAAAAPAKSPAAPSTAEAPVVAAAPVTAIPSKIEVKPAPPPAAPPNVVAAPVGEATKAVPPDAERKTDSAVSAAAAAAAAAMAIAATRSRADQPAKPVAAPPKPAAPATPAVSATPAAPAPARPQVASAGGSGVAADVRTTPLVPADRQDLKLIRGIDEVTERTLHSQGIWRYNDIARWSARDVAAANRVLSTKGRVERENWIEQAALLAGGGLTDFARRRLRGEHAAAKPSAVATPPRPAVPTTAASVAPLVAGKTPLASTPSAAASAAAAAVAAAAAAASRGIASTERRTMPAPQQPPRPIVAAPAAPTPAAAQQAAAPAKPQPVPAAHPAPAIEASAKSAPAITPAAPIAAAPAAPAPAQPTKVAPAAPAPAPAAAASATTSADLLQRIRGIDGPIERLLVGQGVRHYRQIAGWTSSDVDRFEALIGSPGRIGRENWIEQAQILAGGAQTQFARQHDAGEAAASTDPAAVRPARLSDAIRDQQDRGAKPVRNDVSGLRSVRSEALRPAQSDAPRIGGTVARPTAPDDLKRIRGIGVLIEKKLNSLGVASYDQIANWTADDIAHVSDVLDFRGRIERENWVEQARILSAGGQTEFSRRVDRGEIQ